ncbi:hypothetical protein COOONC_09308, partial [Cooperia oncophora]
MGTYMRLPEESSSSAQYAYVRASSRATKVPSYSGTPVLFVAASVSDSTSIALFPTYYQRSTAINSLTHVTSSTRTSIILPASPVPIRKMMTTVRTITLLVAVTYIVVADGPFFPTPALGYARVPLPHGPQYGTAPFIPAKKNPFLGAQFMKPISVPMAQASIKCQKCNCCALLAGVSAIGGGYPQFGPIIPSGKMGPTGPIFPRPINKQRAQPPVYVPGYPAPPVSPPVVPPGPISPPIPSPPPIIQPPLPPAPVLPPVPAPPPVVPPVGPPAPIIPSMPSTPLGPPIGPPAPIIPPSPVLPVGPPGVTPPLPPVPVIPPATPIPMQYPVKPPTIIP